MMNGHYSDGVKMSGPPETVRSVGLSVKAPRHTVPKDAVARDILTSFLSATIEHLQSNLDGVRSGDAEAIKQFRIGLRRFRTVLSLYKRHLPAASVSALRTEAKRIANILGACRDLDVFTDETLPRAMATAPGAVEDAALTTLHEVAERERGNARRETRRLASGRQLARFIDNLRSFEALAAAAPGKKLDAPANDYAVKMLNRRFKAVLQAGDDFAAATPRARHPLRLQLKKLRYSLHAFRPLYPKALRKPYLSSLSALQDAFGELNDAAVARDMAILVASGAGQRDPRLIEAGAGYIIGLTQGLLGNQGEDVLASWQDFAAMRPFWQEGR